MVCRVQDPSVCPFSPTMLAPSLQVRPPDLVRELSSRTLSPSPASLGPTVEAGSSQAQKKAALAPFLPGFATPIPHPVLSHPLPFS